MDLKVIKVNLKDIPETAVKGKDKVRSWVKTQNFEPNAHIEFYRDGKENWDFAITNVRKYLIDRKGACSDRG